MAEIQQATIQRAGALVHRSPRTIRRWVAQGVDVRDDEKLKTFANEVGARTFGRYGNGARPIGKKGGSKTSSVKRQSSKLNGKLGGRHKDGMLLLKKAIRNGNQLDLKNVSDDGLKAIWPTLIGVDKWHRFWVGDVLNEIARRSGASSASLAIRHSPEPKEFQEAMTASQALVPEDRNSLDYRSHVAALSESGNARDAGMWLKVAEEKKWKRPQLRAAIRESLAKRPQSTRTKGIKTITFDLNRLANRLKELISDRPMSEWTRVEIDTFLDDAAPIADAIMDAQERWEKI